MNALTSTPTSGPATPRPVWPLLFSRLRTLMDRRRAQPGRTVRATVTAGGNRRLPARL